jgi:hypothetical protein
MFRQLLPNKNKITAVLHSDSGCPVAYTVAGARARHVAVAAVVPAQQLIPMVALVVVPAPEKLTRRTRRKAHKRLLPHTRRR